MLVELEFLYSNPNININSYMNLQRFHIIRYDIFTLCLFNIGRRKMDIFTLRALHIVHSNNVSKTILTQKYFKHFACLDIQYRIGTRQRYRIG